jgi:hypothetical protein
MHSTLTPKPSDDPHDVVVVAPDAVRVVPADEELSNLLHQAAARGRSDPQTRAAPDLAAGQMVRPVDTTFRPAAVNDVLLPGKGWSMVRRALRASIALLLAGCVGLAAVAWRAYGDQAEKKIAKWTTQLVLTSSLPPEEAAPAAQPAVAAIAADTANAAPPQPAPPAQSAAETVAPAATAASADSAQLLQSMSRDLASLRQEVEQLKAGQQQASHDVARPSEQNLRPRKPALPPRSAAAPARKPVPPYPPRQAAAAPMLPPAAAPYPAPAPYYASRQPDYLPRQPESQPQVAAEPRAEPESSVPRPPMPLSPGIGSLTPQ